MHLSLPWNPVLGSLAKSCGEEIQKRWERMLEEWNHCQMQTFMRIIVILAEIKVVVTWLQLLHEGGLHRVLQVEFLHCMLSEKYMLGKGWLIKSLRNIKTIVFGKLRENDAKFTWVLLCKDCYCLLTSKVTFVFIPCILIICKYLCSFNLLIPILSLFPKDSEC